MRLSRPRLPRSLAGRRRLLRAAQAILVLSILIPLLMSLFALRDLSAHNKQLLDAQGRSARFHSDQARLADERAQRALQQINSDLALQLRAHDRRIEDLLKNLRIEVRALPDGTAKVVVTEAPRATVTATPTPRCERLPNGRCKRD